MAVLTEAREAGRGAAAVRVSDVAVVMQMVMTSALAATSIVVEDALELVRARPMMTDTTVRTVVAGATMTDALAVTGIVVAALVAGAPASPPNSMRMSGINELSSCSSLLRV
jgi:F0F1-type ATP synthase membrane subunit c/vacuolar-type H+-ATPase subunit K